MKKKQYVILLAVVLILALAFCGYKYYTYYYQDVVTDYYGIEYTPPWKEECLSLVTWSILNHK